MQAGAKVLGHKGVGRALEVRQTMARWGLRTGLGRQRQAAVVKVREKEKERKEKLRRQQNTPCIKLGDGDTLARSAESLPHQR